MHEITKLVKCLQKLDVELALIKKSIHEVKSCIDDNHKSLKL